MDSKDRGDDFCLKVKHSSLNMSFSIFVIVHPKIEIKKRKEKFQVSQTSLKVSLPF